MSLKDFFYAFNLCKNFFSRLFAVRLHDFVFSDVMAARIFSQGFFFARIFLGNFHPPPGIFNGLVANFSCDILIGY